MDNSNANTSSEGTTAVKTALITGGAKRIGAVTTHTLHQAGYNVIIHCRLSRQDADTLAAELNDIRADSARVIQGDLNNDTIYNHLIEEAYQCWNRLDVLVNNAGMNWDGVSWKMSEEQWDRVLEVNLKGYFNFTRQVAPVFKDQKYGKIVNVGADVIICNVADVPQRVDNFLTAIKRFNPKEIVRSGVVAMEM